MPIELGSSHRGAEHEFMIKVVGQALGEYGDMIVAHIEKKIAEEVGKLRAEVDLSARATTGKWWCCRTCCASGADKRRPPRIINPARPLAGPLNDLKLLPLSAGLCCKTRKLQRQEFFAKTRSGRRSPIRIPSVAVPKSPVSLTREDQSPHVFTRKTRLQPAEFLITCAKRLLQHNRRNSGHGRTCCWLNPVANDLGSR